MEEPMLKLASLRLGLPAAGTEMLKMVAVVLTKWRFRARSRSHLARLSQRELDDIGVADWQAEREVGKSFWQP
jgi:uncharacterized protein YjiS (DUF1127 family)